MREEIEVVIRTKCSTTCKVKCTDVPSCIKCYTDEILSLFASKVRRIVVDTKRKHGFILSCDYDIGEERGIQNGITAFRDSLLMELKKFGTDEWALGNAEARIAADRILALFAEKVRGVEVENPYLARIGSHNALLIAFSGVNGERWTRATEAFRAALLKELEASKGDV